MKHRQNTLRQCVTRGALSLTFSLALPAQAAKTVTEYSQEELLAVEITSVDRESQHLSEEVANE